MKAQKTGTVHHVIDARTAAVELRRQVVHPKYAKRYHRTTTLLVDSPADQRLEAGMVVTIEATRPISKRKAWKIVSIDDQRKTQNAKRKTSDGDWTAEGGK